MIIDFKLTCDVCGSDENTMVRASAAGPISLVYCGECVRTNREPYGILVAYLSGIGSNISSRDDIADWIYPVIQDTLGFYDKTEEELFADVNAAYGKYTEYLKVQAEKEDA